MRLDKALTRVGLTRSEAKKAVARGRVCLDGAVARDAGADADGRIVTLDGTPVEPPREIHLMLHKPAGYLTATEDSRAKTVMELLPALYRARALGPVGRLDKDVTGLLLLTTDGQLAHRLISPKRNVEKVYEARVEGVFSESDAEAVRAGIAFKDFTARPAKIELLAPGHVRLTLTEGKFHEVKRICARVGHPVIALKRVSIGGVALDPALEEGQSRELNEAEIGTLYGLAGMGDE